jgi:hypothetical protein
VPFLHAKHFSLEEARLALAEVRPLVEELVALKRTLDARGYDIRTHGYFGGMGPNGERYFPGELERLVTVLQRLEALGVQVKGIDQGLIDFPHVRSKGEEVYLCFLAGESDIGYWHSIEAGFAGRRPIREL